MRAEKGTQVRKNQWVVERLQSWGAWANSGGPRGYGESSLTLEEIRSQPVRAYTPVTAEDCERTHEALRKLPRQLYQLAIGLYVEEAPMRLAVKRIRVSERHGWRMQTALINGVEFLLKNPGLKTPPLDLLLNS